MLSDQLRERGVVGAGGAGFPTYVKAQSQVEFVIAMGNWMMFSLLFRNLRIPLAEGIAIWPPDGHASPAAG